jgi:hypothetical protein
MHPPDGPVFPSGGYRFAGEQEEHHLGRHHSRAAFVGQGEMKLYVLTRRSQVLTQTLSFFSHCGFAKCVPVSLRLSASSAIGPKMSAKTTSTDLDGVFTGILPPVPSLPCTFQVAAGKRSFFLFGQI